MKENVSGCFFSEHSVQFLFYTHFITTVMPPGPVSCIGGTKYPHCIVLYCIVHVCYRPSVRLSVCQMGVS